MLVLGISMASAMVSVSQESLSEPAQPASGLEIAQVVEASGATAAKGTTNMPAGEGRRHALIVVGIAGDEEHRLRFQQTADVWRRWLTEVAGVPNADLTVLCSEDESDETGQATAKRITEVVASLTSRVGKDDALWVFLLGHGSQDKRHAWFHLPGPDLNAAEWGGLFAKIQASEQVFWLTHSASGGFIKPMSLPGRIVISACDADGEVNETRFPHVLAEVMDRQLNSDAGEAPTPPASSSVLDLFRSATTQVGNAFEISQLVPTEHALLDDNGDGVGSELADLPTVADATSESSPSPVDGMHAGGVFIKLGSSDERPDAAPASIDSLTSPETPSPAKRKP
jgi:hypothetical protein